MKPLTQKDAQEYIKCAWEVYMQKHPGGDSKFQKALLVAALNKQGLLPDIIAEGTTDPEALYEINLAEKLYKQACPAEAYKFPRNCLYFMYIYMNELEKEAEVPLEIAL